MMSEEIILFVSEYEDSDYVPTKIKETPILILDVDAACDDETDSLREFLVALSDHGFTIKTKGMWCWYRMNSLILVCLNNNNNNTFMTKAQIT